MKEDFYVDKENFCQEKLEDTVGLNEAIVLTFINIFAVAVKHTLKNISKHSISSVSSIALSTIHISTHLTVNKLLKSTIFIVTGEHRK